MPRQIMWGFFLLAACSSLSPSPAARTPAADAAAAAVTTDCAQQINEFTNSDGDKVILCQKLYETAPFIRPTVEDNFSNSQKVDFISGIHTRFLDSKALVILADRRGVKYVAVDSSGNPLELDSGGFDPRLHAPTYRTLFHLYHVQGALSGAVIDHPAEGHLQAIRLSSVAPYLMIDGCAMDSLLQGTWEGDVSQRIQPAPTSAIGGTYFDSSVRVPVSITFTRTKPIFPKGLSDWRGVSPMKDGVSVGLFGKIDNWNSAVASKSGSGSTLPALSSYGNRNPFLGATKPAVQLYRHSNMHGVRYDDHWVFQYPMDSGNLTVSGMSDGLMFFSPTYLFSTQSANLGADFQSVVILPHFPHRSNGNILNIHPVKLNSSQMSCLK